MDERQLWAVGEWDKDINNCLRKTNLKDCNTWEGKGPEMIMGYKIDNAAFLKNKTAFKIAIDALGFNPEKVEAFRQESFEKMNRQYAAHGFGGINLKFLYDPIYRQRLHIYSDGNVDLEKCDLSKVEWSKATQLQKEVYTIWLAKYRDRANINSAIENKVECAAKSMILISDMPSKPSINTLASIEPRSYVHKSEFTKNSGYLPISSAIEQSAIVQLNIFGFDTTSKTYKICLTSDKNILKCEEVSNLKDIKNFLAGNAEPRKYREIYSVYPINAGHFSDKQNHSGNLYNRKVITTFISQDIFVPKEQTFFLVLNPGIDKLKINFEDPHTSKVVLTGNAKEGLVVISKSKRKTLVDEGTRYDHQLLTSCVTVLDMHIENASFDIHGGGCEDAINFIRVTGTIKDLNVKDSPYDAVDMDFSEISINNISVENAGNDCLDLSAGYYNLNHGTFKDCGDKAISLGEKSKLFADFIDENQLRQGSRPKILQPCG